MVKISQALALLSLVVMLLFTACGPAATAPPPATQPPPTAEPPTAIPPTAVPATSAPVEVEKVHLKVFILPFLGYAPYFIAQEEGYFAEQGLEVELVRFDKISEATLLLAKGELDVASGQADVSTLNAIAQGSKIRYVSDKGYLDPEQCTYTGFLLRKDLLDSGALNDLANIKGMKIALTPATSPEYFLDLILQPVGLTSKDVVLLDMPQPNRLEALKTGALDISATAEPWISRTIKAGAGEVWSQWEKLVPNFTFSIQLFGPSLLVENPEAGKRFMVAYLKAVRQYNEGKTERNIEIIAKYTQMTYEEVKGNCWPSLKSDGAIDLQSILDFQTWALAKGYMSTALTPEQFWDSTFIDYANEVLK